MTEGQADAKDERKAEGGARERFRQTLVERARYITSVCNDVYTVKYWQLFLNFFAGMCAVALLVTSMFVHGAAGTAMITIAVFIVVGVAAANYVGRKIKPMSFMQYTCVDKGKRYCFQIISKTEFIYSDGEKTVECRQDGYGERDGVRYPQYRYDFFADMDADVRIGKADKEIYKGTIEHDGKKLKCKIVFKNGVAFVGKVDGARIKYFDVNDKKDKFAVPTALKKAVKACGSDIPKLPGIEIRDGKIQ